MQEDLDRYHNPFLLPPKKKIPEKIIQTEESQSLKHLSPEQIKKKKAAKFGFIITVVLFVIGGLVNALPYLIPNPICGNDICEKNELTSCPVDCVSNQSVEKKSLFNQVFFPSDENQSAQKQLPQEEPLTEFSIEYLCEDNVDNDYDGRTDCQDSDCEYSDYCTVSSLFVFDLALRSPLQTNPVFVSPGQNLTIRFTFTVDLNPVTSNIIIRDIRIGNQQCRWFGSVYYNAGDGMWNVMCTLPTNLMGQQHLFLQIDALDFNETKIDVEFLAVIFPTDSFLYNAVMTSPLSNLSIAAGNAFNMSCRALTNNATGISLAFQYRGSDFAIKDIETVGSVNLTTTEPNPEANIINGTVYRHQVTAHTNGTYYIRCKGDNGSVSINSDFIEVNVSQNIDGSPSQVSGLHVQNSGNSWIYFAWEQAIDDFGIQQYLLFVNGVHLANTTNLYYNLTSLTPNTNYNFSVAAQDTGGNYGLPSTIQASTSGDTPPGPVSNLQSQSSGTTWIYFTWNSAVDDTGIDKYTLLLNSINLANTTNLYYNVTGLVQDTAYNFTVKAIDLAGNPGPEISIQASTQQEGFGPGSLISWLSSITGKLISLLKP